MNTDIDTESKQEVTGPELRILENSALKHHCSWNGGAGETWKHTKLLSLTTVGTDLDSSSSTSFMPAIFWNSWQEQKQTKEEIYAKSQQLAGHLDHVGCMHLTKMQRVTINKSTSPRTDLKRAEVEESKECQPTTFPVLGLWTAREPVKTVLSGEGQNSCTPQAGHRSTQLKTVHQSIKYVSYLLRSTTEVVEKRGISH